MQTLFEIDQTKHDPAEVLTNIAAHDESLSESGVEFADELVRGVIAEKSEIDKIIESAAPSWPISQVAATDRVALEMGVYEVCIHHDTPVEVAINEAVELAKLYGGENSAGFVNGVLRTIAERSAA